MITGASANTNGIEVASYQGDTASYFNSFKQVGDNFTMVKLGGRGGGGVVETPVKVTQVPDTTRRSK